LVAAAWTKPIPWSISFHKKSHKNNYWSNPSKGQEISW